MTDEWEKKLACASKCNRCEKELTQKDERVLSIYDHQPICTECKKEEEKKSDFENVTKQMIASCLEKTGKPYGNPEGFCFHHFCPYKCNT